MVKCAQRQKEMCCDLFSREKCEKEEKFSNKPSLGRNMTSGILIFLSCEHPQHLVLGPVTTLTALILFFFSQINLFILDMYLWIFTHTLF